ncbi:MBL fold metallo-hydrolase [Paracoccus sp. (in: a-proteobacteria)]|uniref:MBL fold metallo-hydrolase n=1 Tax=Paracoccus sp. TaxID=267 RepID=UPI00321FC9A9
MSSRIHAIEAAEGDCLLLECDGRFALIDGGVARSYEARLQPWLRAVLPAGQPLQAVIVSHVDTDHISGVLDLLADIERARADGEPDPWRVAELWHNGFGEVLDDAEGWLAGNLRAMMGQAGRVRVAAANGAAATLGIAQGARLQRLAVKLGIAMNRPTAGRPITQEAMAGRTWDLGRTRLTVIGPTRPNLEALRQDWIAWIERNTDRFALGDAQAMADADDSVPNLSSIVLCAATPAGEVLLTGDARGDHILQGLEQAGLLAADGSRHFRLLKLQHHGSARNATPEFFRRVTADIYLISANGRHGNPDEALLRMILDSAQGSGRQPVIAATNDCAPLAQFRAANPPDRSGYALILRDPARDALTVDLQSGEVR